MDPTAKAKVFCTVAKSVMVSEAKHLNVHFITVRMLCRTQHDVV